MGLNQIHLDEDKLYVLKKYAKSTGKPLKNGNLVDMAMDIAVKTINKEKSK